MPDSCLFCRIVAGEESAEVVAETNEIVVFRDEYPNAPVHLLVTPREHIASAHELREEHKDLILDCILIAQRMVEQEGIGEGYRIATNVGSQGGQTIPHLHFHVLGGKQLGAVDGA
ncbi:MAG: HIT domain-containing protein [Nitriliruptorales bacterium]